MKQKQHAIKTRIRQSKGGFEQSYIISSRHFRLGWDRLDLHRRHHRLERYTGDSL
jgi:hypothetical protein